VKNFIQGRIATVNIDEVAQRIIKAEKGGRKLSKKTIFRLCDYDRGVMREVFRRLRSLKEEKETLSEWLE
jgi:hypothetical protein